MAILNSRLVSFDAATVAFRWKDYRIKRGDRQRVMRRASGEFIRRFLLHVLPDGFYRIPHHGLLASAGRKVNIMKVRAMLGTSSPTVSPKAEAESIPLLCASPAPAAEAPCA